MSPSDLRERRIAWLMLILCPLIMMTVFAYVTFGSPQGVTSGHPIEYLQMTCILWAAVTVILPILRLTRMISLPLWFMLIIYLDMYIYVISLCNGLYMDFRWWSEFSHIIASLVVSSIVFVALCVMQSRSPKHASLGSKNGIILLTIIIAVGFGAMWEIMEGLTDLLSGQDYMMYGPLDTLGDFGADLLGASLMAVVWILLIRDTNSIGLQLRIGKKNIDV